MPDSEENPILSGELPLALRLTDGIGHCGPPHAEWGRRAGR
jgi:hypothetical protein